MPSASTAASSAGLSAAGLPVRRCMNRSANPVHPSTSLRTSVIRTRGSIPFNRRARSRAASGTAGGVRAMKSLPSSISTPSSSPRAARSATKVRRSRSAAVRLAM